jgi:hypothetical protein
MCVTAPKQGADTGHQRYSTKDCEEVWCAESSIRSGLVSLFVTIPLSYSVSVVISLFCRFRLLDRTKSGVNR